MSDLSDREVNAIVRYCSEEVRRQQRGPLQVGNMVAAWLDALHRTEPGGILLADDIRLWGMLIEPDLNVHGWRRVQIYVGDHVPPPPQELERLMDRYVAHLPEMDAEEAYFEFERLHPFRDGNGRVGKIIYCWKSGCLTDPIWPPNRWGISNP